METKMTMAQIRAEHIGAGKHFFDRQALRFFDSKIERAVYQGPGGVYIVTSEQFHGSQGYTAPRKWTVRRFDRADKGFRPVGEFNKLDRDDAIALAKRAARGEL